MLTFSDVNTGGMAAWARKNPTEFYRLYARLIRGESTTEISVSDAEELSTEELLTIACAGNWKPSRMSSWTTSFIDDALRGSARHWKDRPGTDEAAQCG
jgi:hypothetical protein